VPGSDSISTIRARGAIPRRRTLLVMIGDAVETRPLPASGTVAIGRGSTCDVRIEHPSISRDHLALELAANALRVTDRGGSNGTLLRGVRLPASSPVEISANEPV
jgi:pSer/pThr/pTyr-binding forkhead associated (FHA) protein